MIVALSANDSRFRRIEFGPGMNVILADRAKEATRTDSRNGLGKTTFLETLHFCLGSSGDALKIPELAEWRFDMDLVVGGREVTVRRAVAKPNIVTVDGDTGNWPFPGRRTDGGRTMRVDEWCRNLGAMMFGVVDADESNYRPTFRSLISYFIRRPDGFSDPFEFHRKQKEWERQVYTMFLLGLDWEVAQRQQLLREKEALLRSLKAAAKIGVMRHLVGDLGELEAEVVRLREESRKAGAQLSSFQVHPQYREIEQEVNSLTERIHAISNTNLQDRRAVALYEQSLAEETTPGAFDITEIYRAAGVLFPDLVVHRLEEVEAFHVQVVDNRRRFIEGEIRRLKQEIERRQGEQKEFTERRASLLSILQTHKALDEYTALQTRHLEAVASVNELEARLASLRDVQAGQSQVRLEREQLFQRTLEEDRERAAQKARAQALFQENTQFLYGPPPAALIIEATKTGYKFDIEMRRTGSTGVEHMKVFAYDLALAQLWARHSHSPGFLVHDSSVFDGVDERQRALALQRAAGSAAEFGHQYICTFNSDMIPESDFPAGFSLDPFVRLRLTDSDPAGSFLGFRFERWSKRRPRQSA